jgi:hypothetical protein
MHKPSLANVADERADTGEWDVNLERKEIRESVRRSA